MRSITCKTLALKKQTIRFMIPSMNDAFDDFIHPIQNCSGKVNFSGFGKNANNDQKLPANLNSKGSIASFLRAATAVRADLKTTDKKNIITYISKSGHALEIKEIFNTIQGFDVKITGKWYLKFFHLYNVFNNSQNHNISHLNVPQYREYTDMIHLHNSISK